MLVTLPVKQTSEFVIVHISIASLCRYEKLVLHENLKKNQFLRDKNWCVLDEALEHDKNMQITAKGKVYKRLYLN